MASALVVVMVGVGMGVFIFSSSGPYTGSEHSLADLTYLIGGNSFPSSHFQL